MRLIKESEFKRIWERPDGILKIEVFTYGKSGKTIYGSNANGHWKTRGYKKGDIFASKLKDLKEKL